MITKFYKGFSSRHYHDNGGEFGVYNIDCVEEDLMNEIFTVKGERIHMPEFGTRIPIMTFELNDADAQNIVREDLTTVFKNDPRVALLGLDVLPAEDINALVAIAKLQYLQFNVTKDLRIEVPAV
jgi:phage baseplate assembly protein W